MTHHQPIDKELLDYLTNFVTSNRKELFEKNLNLRTRHITVVLEDVFKPHNASAVLRTSDCFGIQDVHIIEGERAYKVNKGIVKGAAKWLTLSTYENTKSAISKLRNRGYTIVGTSPHAKSVTLNELPINQKIALFYGNEDTGLSKYVIDEADVLVSVPMYGFTESFNISVTAAICLNQLVQKLHQSAENWHLTEEEKEVLRLEWYRKSLTRLEKLEKNFYALRKRKKIS